MTLTLATWNVNSIKARLPNALDWLTEAKPDIVCLQEIKTVDEGFPREEIERLGYNIITHGQ
ncbi:endonuclease/exonuclease/phosphatase family protein, partial [uncultured Maricaulis sp.]|uniref:endonuclease/exonuclease/phosphatase family protein n=1 Tax=uncultured Maricaulis sp. TaxID=174710 RepID=UPI0030DB3C05